MANDVKDVKIPYEILVRFGSDGKPKGAHAQFIERLIIDGVVRSENIGNAEPIDLEGFPTSAIMSDTTRDALAEVQRLYAEIEVIKAEASKVANEAEQTINGLKRDLADMTARVSAA